MTDGRYGSRKLWLTLFTEALLVGTALAAARWPAVAPTYTTLSGALVATAALYMTGNVAAKHVTGKLEAAAAAKNGDSGPTAEDEPIQAG